MTQRWFTPDSARKALEAARPAAEKMCRIYDGLEDLRPAEIVSDQHVEPGYFRLVQKLNHAMETLNHIGAQIKDAKHGLIDFPARRRGRPVLLCWKVGESSRMFWHELDAGFAGRQPVDDDGPWDPVDTTARMLE